MMGNRRSINFEYVYATQDMNMFLKKIKRQEVKLDRYIKNFYIFKYLTHLK